ncbi:MAG TPA: TetR/AcrR family transcriptional regulator [Acidimicrobiales bacterium]
MPAPRHRLRSRAAAAVRATNGDTGGGRPRDPAIDAAVLETTRTLLLEVGYPRLTIDRVARRAGVTRPAIYRRWPSKMHMVHEAVFRRDEPEPAPDTGTLAGDLRVLVERGFRSYTRPEVRAALPGLVADLRGDPETRHSVFDRLDVPARVQLADVLDRAAARGEIPPADHDVVFDMLHGALFHRVVARDELDDDYVERLTTVVLRALGLTDRA